MTLDEVLKYYGGGYQFKKQTKMSYSNVYNWRDRGFIPLASQGKLEQLTNGALKASVEDLVIDDLRR